jgi:hypothetical protein
MGHSGSSVTEEEVISVSSPASGSPFPDVVISPEEQLDEAFNRVKQTFAIENLEIFDPVRAYGTSTSRLFARYFTLNVVYEDGERINHVFFVITDNWEEQVTRDFLLSYLVMPATPPNASGKMRFHFYSAFPLPAAVRYLFSNRPQGALEAAVLSEVGTIGWSADSVEDVSERIVEILDRLMLISPEALGTICPTVLDELYHSLSLPYGEDSPGPLGQSYRPEGTLAAIGLLVGESIRIHFAGAAYWENDDLNEVYPRLRVSGVSEGILRPISMILEFFTAGVDVLPSVYCQRMIDVVTLEGIESFATE